MAEQKYITYTIEVNTASGKVKIDGLTDGFVKADIAAKRLNTTMHQMEKNTGQVASKAGLAGALVTEMGRTVSDANYGMMAMANNLQQVSTLFVTLISTTGGLAAAMRSLWTAVSGPLGLILAFQLLITLMENKAVAERGATKAADDHTRALKEQADAVDRLNKQGRLYVESTKTIVRLEQELEDLKLYDPKNWREVAEIRTKIITEQLRLLKAEKASKEGLLSPEEQLKLNQKIFELEQERSRVLGEAFKGREKEKKLDTSLFGITEIQAEQMIEAATSIVDSEEALEARRTTIARDAAQARGIIASREAEQRIDALGMIGDAVQSFGDVIGEQTAAGKAVAAAGAIIETYAAVAKALNTPGLGLARIPYAISVGAFGLAQVRRILSTNVPRRGGGGSGGGSAPGLPAPQQPSFNIVGATQGNQIRDTIQDALGKPIRAYVTTRDIRSGEELDRNIVRGATVG